MPVSPPENARTMRQLLDDLSYDNSFVRQLPADPEADNHRRQVHQACYSRVQPTPVAMPKLLAHASEVAELVGLHPNDFDRNRFATTLAGNHVAAGMAPYAACYGGHQFGNWAGQLGDGRAITLGETVNTAGERWELQLKGAGPTPYSRSGDGRAVVRSSVREFLCSEAMYHLGVPTTRALSLVATGDAVVRDMFYDGNARPEPGATVCRVAPSFLRFGNFEIFASRGDNEVLKQLADYAIATHFPHLGPPSPEVYVQWLTEVCTTTATMIVDWMRVGFVHGVMNTDNMSILGLTIDYGPYGWLEDYDPGWTPNTTDAAGRRYAFGNQPQVALWNLARFASALVPLVGSVESLEKALRSYSDAYSPASEAMMAAKLGFTSQHNGDEALSEDLLLLLQRVETDMTIFFRLLADVPSAEDANDANDERRRATLHPAYYAPDTVPEDVVRDTDAWLRRYTTRLRKDGLPDNDRRARMNAVNPKYVLRNYLAQLAIDPAEQGDGSEVERLLEVLRRPFDEQPGNEAYAAKRPEWARHRPGCSMLSCSS